MKTFTLNDLKNKEYQFVDENNVPLINDKGQQITNVREYIQVMARKISQRRKKNTNSIKDAKLALDKKANDALTKIKIITDLIPSLVKAGHLTPADEKDIQSSCHKAEESIISYQRDINILYDRISHGKIRISSVGLHRQGKTTFARLFTGLDNKVLPSETGLTDTTGTLVVLNHVKEGVDPKYFASYYTKDEIIKTVNTYIKKIQSQRPGWTIIGKSEISSIEELVSMRGQDSYIETLNSENGATVPVNIDYISGLAPYFRKPIDEEQDWVLLLTDKEEAPKPLGSIESVRQHILMNETIKKDDEYEVKKKTLYLAVREVHINIPFKRNSDLFDLIEIVDTKGGGDTAGSHVNEEIKKAIDMSDAVFSLHKTTTSEYNFNTELAKFYDLKSGLKEKHFIIINKVVMRDKNNRVEKNNDVNTIKDKLSGFNQSDISYCGDLTDDNAQIFADYIIADMLYHIAKHVNEFDNDRIKNCNEKVKTINTEINCLCSILDNPYPNFNEDDAILRNIKQMVADAKKYIDSQITAGNLEEDPNEKPTYSQLIDNNDNIKTLYWLITGNNEPSNNSSKVLEDEKKKYSEIYDDPDPVITELLRAVFDVFSKIKSNQIPNEEHAGEYIEQSVNKLNRSIAKRINDLTKQERIGIKEGDEIFGKLWLIFKLNQCFSSGKNWENSNIQNENSFFDELHDIYKEVLQSTSDWPKDTLCAYKILKTYFKNDDEEFEEKTSQICVDDSRLRIILAHAFNEEKLDETIVNMSTVDKRTRSRIAKKVMVCLKGDDQIAELCKSFYAYHKNNILSPDDLKEIELSRNWHEISIAKKVLNESFKSLPSLS